MKGLQVLSAGRALGMGGNWGESCRLGVSGSMVSPSLDLWVLPWLIPVQGWEQSCWGQGRSGFPPDPPCPKDGNG